MWINPKPNPEASNTERMIVWMKEWMKEWDVIAKDRNCEIHRPSQLISNISSNPMDDTNRTREITERIDDWIGWDHQEASLSSLIKAKKQEPKHFLHQHTQWNVKPKDGLNGRNDEPYDGSDHKGYQPKESTRERGERMLFNESSSQSRSIIIQSSQPSQSRNECKPGDGDDKELCFLWNHQ